MSTFRFPYRPYYTNSRALVIGIDKYAKASPLSYAVSDAREVYNILTEEFGFPTENVIYLTDADATKDRILKAYYRFARDDIEVDERLLIFFAGHGYTRTGTRGEIGFLVPYDADFSDLTTLIRWDELTRNSELIRAKHIMFIMDACYGGLALTRHLRPGSARFLKDMMRRYSRQVLTAGKADEVVADVGGPIPNHSVFTGHLIEGLRGKAATPEGVITANGLMAYVYEKVANDKNSHQTPHYGYFDGDGDFIFRAPNLTKLESAENNDLDHIIIVPYPEEHSQPETIDAKVHRVKSLLATESASIELHEFLINEVRQFLAATSEDCFSANGEFSQEEFLRRVTRYEEVSMDLAVVLACVSYWAKPVHKATLQKVLARSSDRLEQLSGLRLWLALRWYPLILELYCAGIAAVDAQRFDSLATVFYTPIPTSESQTQTEMFVNSTAYPFVDLSHVFRQVPGYERKYVPLSEYLFKTLQPKLDDVLFLGKSYEEAFDTFEVFYALAVADLDLLNGGDGWGPVGRFGWKYCSHHSHDKGPLARIVAQGRAQRDAWAPIQAGLFGGSFERFDAVATKYMNRIAKLEGR